MQGTDNQQNKADDQASWWFKLLTRGVGTVGGVGKIYLTSVFAI